MSRRLTAVLASWAARRPHVLIVAVPGHARVRWAVEQSVLAQGGTLALSPADADVLLLAGPAAGATADSAARVWEQMPHPKVLTKVSAAENAAAVVAAAVHELSHAPGNLLSHAAPAGNRLSRVATLGSGATPMTEAREEPQTPMGSASSAVPHNDHQANKSEDGRRQHDPRHDGSGATLPRPDDAQNPDVQGMGDHDMGGQGHHGHDMGGMEMPGGLMMADRVDDRDGLKLDVLHVPFGPVLAFWPAGLVVETTLAGEVVVEADWWVLDAEGVVASPTDLDAPARHLDAVATLLMLAGADGLVALARGARDRVLRGWGATDLARPEDVRAVSATVDALARSAQRTLGLQRVLSRIGVMSALDADAAGLPPGYVGSAWDRLMRRLAAVMQQLGGPAGAGRSDDAFRSTDVRSLLEVTTRLMIGVAVDEARLLVASLAPDTDMLAVGPPTVPHGGPQVAR